MVQRRHSVPSRLSQRQEMPNVCLNSPGSTKPAEPGRIPQYLSKNYPLKSYDLIGNNNYQGLFGASAALPSLTGRAGCELVSADGRAGALTSSVIAAERAMRRGRAAALRAGTDHVTQVQAREGNLVTGKKSKAEAQPHLRSANSW